LDLSTSLQYVKGIGPVRAKVLAAKGLLTVADLLYYAPFRYEDRRNMKTVAQLAPGEKAAVLAWVRGSKLSRVGRKMPAGFMASDTPKPWFPIPVWRYLEKSNWIVSAEIA
jgi:RecG-like helicase